MTSEVNNASFINYALADGNIAASRFKLDARTVYGRREGLCDVALKTP